MSMDTALIALAILTGPEKCGTLQFYFEINGVINSRGFELTFTDLPHGKTEVSCRHPVFTSAYSPHQKAAFAFQQ